MKQELFNSKTKVEDYQRQPKQLGLYEASHEHDACGVGMLVNIQGGKSHELVESALKVLENMRHRGAEGADNKTGDGSNHWFYSFALREPDGAKRDRLLRCLNDRQIQGRPIWKLNHTQTPFRKYRAMDCKNAEEFYDRVINIPCGTNLTGAQLDRVCEALLEFAPDS